MSKITIDGKQTPDFKEQPSFQEQKAKYNRQKKKTTRNKKLKLNKKRVNKTEIMDNSYEDDRSDNLGLATKTVMKGHLFEEIQPNKEI